MRIAILGAGYAGVTLARRLESTLPGDVDLVVVEASETHLVKHEVHRVIRRPAVADAIRVPLSALFDRATVRIDRVTGLDPDGRAVHLAAGDDLSYDYVAVCLGSVTADYGIPGVAEHGQPLTSVDDALGIRHEFLSAAGVGDEAGSEATGDAGPPGSVDVVVGGAGLSGVQTAGELVALAREEGVDADVTLLEQLPHVAPNFPENFRRAARKELESTGVTVSTDTTVERATADAVETNRETFGADVFVWTGGITGTGAMGGDRPLVYDDLRLDDHAFVVGDAARAVDADGEPVPASASAAIREARTVAANIRRLVDHDRGTGEGFRPRLDPYRFDVPGWIVTVGDGTVAQLGPEVVTGSPARAMKAAVGAGHLSSVGAVRNAVDLVESELWE
ncbi:NADH dehydrogenase [Halobellus salinus]|uniref:NADH dehydrogenase n=1 Tax=Halobellus salinus TaxID=931585 RepID=A0A830E985_9EURY|nr:FAD-dependent oxidoreductase [Halobellus salinus]GGJ02807.1 NADH dehydrogenase [Halobellus salinus]SMP22169.1 NADH dehydrogenase [Halobellus salinus]